MNPALPNQAEKPKDQDKAELAQPAQQRPTSIALARLREWFGFGDDAPRTPQSFEGDYDRFESAVEFKRWGDHVIAHSDMTAPGYHYVVAASLYTACLKLVQAVPSSPDSCTSTVPAEQGPAPDFIAMGPAERKACAEDLRNACAAKLGVVAQDFGRAARPTWARPLRVGVTSVGLLGLLTLVVSWWDGHSDLVEGRAWEASSSLAACQPIAQGGCPANSGVFFQTKEEENPWILYDLEKPTRFSRIDVENSRNGFTERAVPLIVEVGDDQVAWREVARMTVDFKAWTTTFPVVTARYVRLRVSRVTSLHLARVSIHR